MEDKMTAFSLTIKLGVTLLLSLLIGGVCSKTCDPTDSTSECKQTVVNHETEETYSKHLNAEDHVISDKSNILHDQEQTLKDEQNDKPDNTGIMTEEIIDKVDIDSEPKDVIESQDIVDDKNNHDTDDRKKTADVEKTDETDTKENVPSSENNIKDTNLTFFHWLKYIIDPIIEEFKDGIYVNTTNSTNTTGSNDTSETSNVTTSAEIVYSAVEMLNSTALETANVTDSSKKTKFQCVGRNVTDNVNATVKLITTAKLLQMFEKNGTENVTDCVLVMFYAPWCHFCAKTAPHYNALARAFPQLDFVAVDTAQFSNLLARFGTVSVPNILVFHQSKSAIKFNHTERTLEYFKEFVTNATGFQANETVNVTELDYLGPVPSIPTNEPDYLLMVAWAFVIFCSLCMFIKSSKGQQWINRVRILWQEHQHID